MSSPRTRARALASRLASAVTPPPPTGAARATTDESHRLALVHPAYDGFITLELRAQTDLADLRVVVGAALDRVLTAHHRTGAIAAGQVRPVDLELHPGSIERPTTSGVLHIVDEHGDDAAPPVRITLASDRTFACQLAGALDGPWSDEADFEQAVEDLRAGRGDARRLSRRISVVFAGSPDPGWSRLPWRRA